MGPLDRRQRELEERKELILEKSRELFFEKGFEEVTIQDICDAVEYGRSAIYGLFESKEEIYSYIYLEAMHILIGLGSDVDPESSDFDTEFMKMGDVMFRFYDEYPDYYMATSHFNSKSMSKSKIPPKIMEQKEALIQKMSLNFINLIQKHIDGGYIRPLDPSEILQLCFAGIMGIIGVFIITENENLEEIRNAVMTHTEIYLRGIKA